MDNKLYKRPMFRRGGSTGGGITSGLQSPRQGYKDPGTVQQDDFSKVDLRNMNMQQLKELSERMAYKAPPQRRDNSFNNFLIDFGLNLASTSPTGNLISTAATAAKDPFKTFQGSKSAYNQGLAKSEESEYASGADMFKTLIGAQSKIKGSESAGKTYQALEVARALEGIIPQIYDLQKKQNDGSITEDEIVQLDILKTKKNNFTKRDVITDSAIELFVKSSTGQTYFTSVSEDLLLNDQKTGGKTYKGENDPQLIKDTFDQIKKLLGSFSTGGRAGYANGELVEEQVTETVEQGPGITAPETDNPISYDQLRARLPQEITDDIINLMANSVEALEDFAMISTQQQVDQFNKKYSVNLVLPAEA